MHLMRRPRWLIITTSTPRILSSRKEKTPLLVLGLFPNLGALLTRSFRGRRGLLAIKCTVLRGRSKDLSGRVSGGSRIGTRRLFMAGGDSDWARKAGTVGRFY